MTEDEQKVLACLANGYREDFGYWRFASIASETTLPIYRIRAACRSLAQRGLAHFRNGLWTEDGEPAGSGYCCTKAGIAEIERETTT